MSKIGKVEWIFVYIIALILDIVQIIIDLFGVGVVINEIADPIIGVIFFAYFQFRGVSMIKYPSRILSLLGVAGLEEFTGGLAPAWVVDVWYIHRTVKKEDALAKANENQEEIYSNPRKPAYQDGVRLPSNANYNSSSPVNENGVRPPRLD